ncbi:MAG: type II toxin-antitoxin system HicB family antitoxin [Candidatus Paceibacterota bacterium]
MVKHNFTAVYKKSGKWFLGWVEEIPGANTQGKTLKETKVNLIEATKLIIETNRSLNTNQKNLIKEPLVFAF